MPEKSFPRGKARSKKLVGYQLALFADMLPKAVYWRVLPVKHGHKSNRGRVMKR
jgi:hypothetical protein